MRIDSSLGHSQYQSRYLYGSTTSDDVATEPAVVSRSRSTGGNSTSTLLSTQLANALWSLDSARKGPGLRADATPSAAADDSAAASPADQVEARYREYMEDDEA